MFSPRLKTQAFIAFSRYALILHNTEARALLSLTVNSISATSMMFKEKFKVPFDAIGKPA